MDLPNTEANHQPSIIYAVQIDNDVSCEKLKHLLKAIKEHRGHICFTFNAEGVEKGTDGKENLVIIGDHPAHAEAVTVSEFFIRMWRRHRIPSNERQTVLSAEDQLVVVQLCLAGINKEKIGDFDVEASTVIEMHRLLEADKMKRFSCPDSQGSAFTDEFLEFRQAYDSYLANCNMIDVIDVFSKVREEVSHNGDLLRDLSSNIIVISKPKGQVEAEMIKFLADRCAGVKIAKLCMSLGSVIDSEKVHVEFEESSLEKALEICEDIKCTASSVTEMHVKGVVLSYLHLLVNSRSELGLARVLNVPDRELDHKAFTALKREAQNKGLSMYQTAMSFVMRLRMGGSGYASLKDSPLGLYVKGLSEFIDLMHKLQTIIEEEICSAKAVKRVMNIIKNAIKKHKDNLLRPESVEKCVTRLQEHAALIQASLGSANFSSPNRPANMGGSMLGRDTLRVMRHLLDTHAGTAMVTHSVDILSDTVSSQKTPLRFPSLLSKFRSPVEVSPDGKIEKSLTERMIEKMSKKPKVSAVPRYQSCYDWAQPLHNVGLGKKEPNTVLDYVPSKTLVCSAESKVAYPRRLLESVNDQENVVFVQIPEEAVGSHTSDHNVTNNSKRENKKRPAGQENSISAPPQKKSKSAPKAAKPNKKKTLPLQRGQKQLTSFFRM